MTDQRPRLVDLEQRYPRLYMYWAGARGGDGSFNEWWFSAVPQATLGAPDLDAVIEPLCIDFAIADTNKGGSPFWSA